MAEREDRPRVLIVTRNFPPLCGGMERLNWHLADELARHCELRLVAPAGAASHVPDGVTVSEVPLDPLPRFLLHAAHRARLEARRWRPHWVIAGSGLTAPQAWCAARACGARTAAYVHGLDLTVSHSVYRALWHPVLRRMHRVVANSSATASLACGLGIDPQRVSVVHPGADSPEFDGQARERFRTAHGFGADSSVLLSVGRLTERKGLREFVAEVLPRIVQRRPEVVLAIVGDAPMHALHARTQSVRSILQAAQAAGVGAHVRVLGKLDEESLNDAYFAADLHVFPVRDLAHDVEGFGMVAVEAAAHALATVAYACGGVVDAVADGISGSLVPPGDAQAFADAVLRLLQRPLPAQRIRRFADDFTWPRFSARLMRAAGIGRSSAP